MTEPTPSTGTTPGTGKRVAVASARAAGATIAVGVAVAVIAAAGILPLPTFAVAPASIVITPVATPQQAVCPGAFLRLGNDEGENAGSSSAIGVPTVLFGPTDAAPTSTAVEGVGTPTLLASDAGSALISGSQTQALAEPDVAGFTAASCASGSNDSWLVGGSTAVGRTTLITLTNPTDVTSTVALEIFGEAGAVSAPGTTGIAVAPRSQTVLALAGFAPEIISPVIHVTSTGGSVVADLQQSVVRGLENAGADIVGTTAKPATSVAIPGLVITTPEAIENRIALGEGSDDLETIVRIFAPGDANGTATVGVAPISGDDTGASFTVDLTGGTAVDVPLSGLAAGSYVVTVDSDVPVVAAARSSTASTPEPASGTSDFSWLPAPALVVDPTSFTVSSGPDAVIHIANTADAAADVTLTAPDGEIVPVALEPGSAVALDIPVGTWQLVSTQPVSASIGYSSDTQLAGFTVAPRLADAGPMTIYP
jgi:hypothetical protein